MASILSRLGLTGASYTGLLLVAAPPAEGDNCASFWAITAEHRRIHIVASGQRLKARCCTLRSQGVVRVVDMLVFIKPTCSVEDDVSVLLRCVPFNFLLTFAPPPLLFPSYSPRPPSYASDSAARDGLAPAVSLCSPAPLWYVYSPATFLLQP